MDFCSDVYKRQLLLSKKGVVAANNMRTSCSSETIMGKHGIFRSGQGTGDTYPRTEGTRIRNGRSDEKRAYLAVSSSARYDTFDPRIVVPEYTVDVGTKRVKK